jgi:EmrB/QacA subfamily drug resistance transporter
VTRARSASSADGAPRGRGERAVLWTVALASLLVPLNSTMIAVALPRLVDDLGTSLASAGWLVTGYLIAMASLQPVAGKLGDRFGPRPLLLGGLGWLAVASAAAAAADSLPLLVAFRLQQAVAGALIVPNAMALLRETVPAERLGSRLGLVGAAMPLGAAAGPPLGGLLLAVGGWQGIFLVNLPLVGTALALGLRALPAAAHPARPAGFDRAGALLLPATLVVAAWALNGSGLSGATAAALGASAALLLAVLVRFELRRPDPVLQPRLFARRAFSAASAGVALSNLAMYVALLALPVLLARREGFGTAAVGLVLASMSAASLVVTPLGGRLADRTGPRLPAAAGLALQGAGLVPLALWPGSLPGGALVAAMVVAGAGLGLASSALQMAAIAAVDAGATGVAAGVFSTSRYAGSIVGTALLAGPLAPASHGIGGFALLFGMLVVAAAGSALVALLLPTRRHRGAGWAGAARGSRGAPAFAAGGTAP